MERHKVEPATKNVMILSINGAKGVDGGDHVTFPAVIAAEGVYKLDKTGENGYRNGEETRKMIRFSNGLRVMEKHPDELFQFIGADLSDDEFPVFGATVNAHESKKKGKNGEVRIATDLIIDKKDRAGNDRTGMIEAMQNGDINEISIQYFFIRVNKSGEFAGQKYDFLETDVNPYALGIMTDGWSAKCGPDTCAIGLSGSKDEEGDKMPDGNETPPGEGGPKTTTLNMNAEIKEAIKTMCPDVLAEMNGGVGKVKARVGELEELNKKMEEEKVEREKERAELEKYKEAEVKAAEVKLEGAVKAMEERLGAEKYKELYPAEVETTYDDYERDWKRMDAAVEKVAPKADDAPAPAPEAPPAAEPGQNAEPAPFWGLNGGAIRKGETEPEDDGQDQRIPLPRSY